jgi:hypothetical protein
MSLRVKISFASSKSLKGKGIPVDEAQLVHSFNSQNDFSHVEPCDVLAKDLILDEHCHQVSTWQELHEHVEEGWVLERRVQFDEPWTLCVGENIALGADMGKLIFLVLWNLLATELVIARWPESYHLCLDKRFEGVDLLVTLPLNKFDFTKGTFADDLQCAVVLRAFGSSEETEEVCFLLLGGVLLLLFASVG